MSEGSCRPGVGSMELVTGIEPVTSSLPRTCSTTELHDHGPLFLCRPGAAQGKAALNKPRSRVKTQKSPSPSSRISNGRTYWVTAATPSRSVAQSMSGNPIVKRKLALAAGASAASPMGPRVQVASAARRWVFSGGIGRWPMSRSGGIGRWPMSRRRGSRLHTSGGPPLGLMGEPPMPPRRWDSWARTPTLRRRHAAQI